MLFRAVCIVVLSLCVSNCGFHLRKANAHHLSSVLVQFSNNCPRFENQLHSYFQSHHIDVRQYDETSDTSNSGPLLVLGCPVLTEQPLVYDGEGQLRRERLNLSFDVAINQQPSLALSIMRERQLNSNQSLADNAEKKLIIEEMQESLLYQLLTKMAKV